MRSELLADTRLRLAALAVLAFCFSSLHTPESLAGMVGVTAVAVLFFGPAPGDLARRLRLPGLVVAALVVLLPFASGRTVVAAIGPIGVTAEGLTAAAGIALRFLCIFSLIVALVGQLPPQRLISALRALGMPAMLTDMAMLMLRHVEDIRGEFTRMRTAKWLRGVPAGYWHGEFRAAGWILASMLLRSHARSERVYHAMILRGHGAPGAAPEAVFAARPADWAALTAMVATGAGLVLLERLV